MKSLIFVVLTTFLLCCCSHFSHTGKDSCKEEIEYADDTIVYKGDTIVYAGYLKFCDTIAIDSIL